MSEVLEERKRRESRKGLGRFCQSYIKKKRGTILNEVWGSGTEGNDKTLVAAASFPTVSTSPSP
jgi:hypothetical protein